MANATLSTKRKLYSSFAGILGKSSTGGFWRQNCQKLAILANFWQKRHKAMGSRNFGPKISAIFARENF